MYAAESHLLGTYDADGGIVVKTDELLVNQAFVGELMKRWWEKHPEAGMTEFPDVIAAKLRLCMWVEDASAHACYQEN